MREAMKKVDYTQLRYNDETGILSTENTDIQIELGAIGKGYAIEQAKDDTDIFRCIRRHDICRQFHLCLWKENRMAASSEWH